MKWWVQVVATILLAGATAFASAMMTHSRDMERVATVEAQVVAQRDINRLVLERLARIDDKLDRLIEERAVRRKYGPAWGQ